jgi:hypothetical protein
MTLQESAGDNASDQSANAADLLTQAISILLDEECHIAAAHAQAALDHLLQGGIVGS